MWRDLSAGGLALVSLIGTLQTLPFPVLWEIIPGLGVSIMVFILAKRSMRPRNDGQEMLALAFRNGKVDERLQDAESKIQAIAAFVEHPRCQELKLHLLGLVSISSQLLLSLNTGNDMELFSARNFIGYYLDEVLKIVDGFANENDARRRVELLQKIDQLFPTVQSTFARKIEQIKRQEDLQLDADMQVFKSEIENSGIN